MKKIIIIIGLLVFTACSSIKFVDSWRNEEITTFKPKKLLVVGMTDNLTARKFFEEELKEAFALRGIYAEESTIVFDKTFTKSKKSEAEVNEMIQEIANKGFDAVVISTVKGVDKKINYPPNYYSVGYRWSHFGHYYLRFQDVYYNPGYYESYTVYNVETSIYNLNEDESKSLVWMGSLNLVDPQTIAPTVKKYVAKIIRQLEIEKLIEKRG
ncbi:hypothetical protein [uncultured Lutibacter sp.]|uniref:hypothetical protein n=1 Tax=uncultured Lutibacter sp. TaxID=437739 RepID=UPI002604BB79|nr:hypothetical protein [uncultured Lutibacter sp.]